MRIGIVDLDTSHPENWVPIERELGHEVIGVYDGGDVHPPGYAREFAAAHNIPRVYDSVAEMVDQVDCAILHGCDWDKHVEKARPFVEAGKSMLIDKPVAGRLSDLRQIEQWIASGARIAGGSALRYCSEVRDWLAQPAAIRGTPHTAFVGCGVDEFNYGIHAYSLLCSIMGSGIQSVKHLSCGVQRRIQITWSDGRAGFLIIGKTEAWLPFYATIVTEKTVKQLLIDHTQLYRSILGATLPRLAASATESPAGGESLVTPELCALAARRSWTNGGVAVRLDEISENDCYDGASFARLYRAARYPG